MFNFFWKYNQINNDLQNRVEILDTKLQREDRNKNEMREKVKEYLKLCIT